MYDADLAAGILISTCSNQVGDTAPDSSKAERELGSTTLQQADIGSSKPEHKILSAQDSSKLEHKVLSTQDSGKPEHKVLSNQHEAEAPQQASAVPPLNAMAAPAASEILHKMQNFCVTLEHESALPIPADSVAAAEPAHVASDQPKKQEGSSVMDFKAHTHESRKL